MPPPDISAFHDDEQGMQFSSNFREEQIPLDPFEGDIQQNYMGYHEFLQPEQIPPNEQPLQKPLTFEQEGGSQEMGCQEEDFE